MFTNAITNFAVLTGDFADSGNQAFDGEIEELNLDYDYSSGSDLDISIEEDHKGINTCTPCIA